MSKSAAIGFLVLVIMISSAAFAKPEVAKEGRILTGKDSGETVKIKIVRIGPKDNEEVLMQVTGTDRPWEGEIQKCKKTPTGTAFTYVCDGSNRLRDESELFVGPKSVYVHRDGEQSKLFDTQAFLTEYLKTNKE